MPKIKLAANLASRDSTLAYDALLTNAFAEQAAEGEEGRVIKRPGFSLSASLGAGCAQGAITFNGGALFVQNDKIWINFNSTASGVNWTSATSPPKPTNGDIAGSTKPGYAVSHMGSLYHIGGKDSADTNIAVYKSTDNGSSWTTILTTAPFAGSLLIIGSQCAVSLNGRIFVILSDKSVWSSADGINWTKNSSDLSGGDASRDGFAIITHGGLIYALLSRAATTTYSLWSSADGATWASVNAGIATVSMTDNSAFLSFNGTLWLIAGMTTGPTALDDVYKSVDNGVTWTLVTAAAAFGNRRYPMGFVYNNKMWIMGGANSALTAALNDVYSSTDGATWTLVTAAAGWGVRYAASTAVHNNTMYVGPGLNRSGGNTIAASSLHFATIGGASSFALTTPTQPCLRVDIALIPANGANPVKAFIKSTKDAWVFDGTTVTKVTDVDYPATTVQGVAYLDGAIYVMDAKGVVYGSDLLNPLSWNALNFISANTEADAGVCLARQLQYIIAFKEYSTEVFYDAANATGSPLGKVQSALLEVGMASATSAAYSENTVYYLANSKEKGRSAQMMEGYTPKSISTEAVERVLNGDDLANVWAFTVKIAGHFFYVVTMKTSAVTLAYDAKTGVWARWTKLSPLSAASVTSLALQSDGTILATMPLPHGQSDGDVVKIAGAAQSEYNGTFNLTYDPSIHSSLQFSYRPLTQPSVTPATGTLLATFYQSSYFPGVYYAKGINSDLLLDESTGGVYSFDPLIYQDNSQPIDMKIRTNNDDFGTSGNKKKSTDVVLNCDKLASGNSGLLRYSDDDYQTWAIFRPVDLASTYPRLNRIGRFRYRAWELKFSGNSPFRARYLDLDLT